MSDPTSGRDSIRDYGEPIREARDYVADKVSVVGDKVSVVSNAPDDDYFETIRRFLIQRQPIYRFALSQLLLSRSLFVFLVTFFGIRFVFDQYLNRVLTVVVVMAVYLILELTEFRQKVWSASKN
jgi:hypothetical protein